MLFDAVKKFWDAVQVNLPIGGALAIVTLADVEVIAKIGVLTVSAICTIVVTIHKTKKKERDE